MRFQTDLIPARLIRRYKRFLADCQLEDGREIIAHVANPGAMTGLAEPGQTVWLEPNDDPKRKLRYTWRLAVPAQDVLVGVDTGLANKIVEEALTERRLPALAYDSFRREVKYGENSRVDFLLEGARTTYLEVKSVTLSRARGLAEFPDTKTARGAKHLGELANVTQTGARAVLLYLVQRNDCDQFAIATDIDPAYAAAHDAAGAVETLVYGCDLSRSEITMGARLDLRR